MNKIQLLLFVIYILSMWTAGSAVRQWITPEHKPTSRAWYLGEGLLLGGIVIVTQMLLLSLVGLYRAPFLWGAVLCNFAFLLLPKGRRGWSLLKGPLPRNPATIVFLMMVLFFIFRNCYFLVDVDSHSTYLYTQKLWLEHASSIFASRALDMKVFVPQFNAVPYALGLSIFPGETFFPQLIVMSWTVILLLLVYGYVASRLSPLYGLGAAMLTVFNDHMYFSGANQAVIINSALIAMLFASAANFWEAKRTQKASYVVLALVFLAQVMANKYQLFYVFMFLGIFGLLIQGNLWKLIRSIIFKPRWILVVVFSVSSLGLWFLKNWISTGIPTFPILAGEARVLGWTKEQAHIFNQVFAGPLPFMTIIKYFSYMCFWPGVNAAKVFIGLMISFPLLVFLSMGRDRLDRTIFQEMCYWVILAIVGMLGICMVSFVDPRHYRYDIALMAVAGVFGVYFLLRGIIRIPRSLEVVLVLLITGQGWGIMLREGGDAKVPGVRENWLALTDQLQMKHMVHYYYPNNAIINAEWPYYSTHISRAAWDLGTIGKGDISAFLAPTLPQVGLWYTTAVRWESYNHPLLISQDLSELGIDVLMTVDKGHMHFEDAVHYAQRATMFDRHPNQLVYNYDFPAELSIVRY